jgi:hypothetical protein
VPLSARSHGYRFHTISAGHAHLRSVVPALVRLCSRSYTTHKPTTETLFVQQRSSTIADEIGFAFRPGAPFRATSVEFGLKWVHLSTWHAGRDKFTQTSMYLISPLAKSTLTLADTHTGTHVDADSDTADTIDSVWCLRATTSAQTLNCTLITGSR